jgi:pimeloyl-ACP methyl ester carboxylesterase
VAEPGTLARRPRPAYVLTGDGPPVLLLHGLGGDQDQALRMLPAEERRTRIAVDMPGHGDTAIASDEPVTFEHFAELTAALLDHIISTGDVRPGPMPVVGVSMGAGVGLALAAARPDLVERLALVRPAWLIGRPTANLAPFRVIAELLDELGPASGEQAFASSAVLHAIEREAPAMAASLLKQFRRPDARGRARVLAEITRSQPLPDRAAYQTITVDTLVLVAPQDPVHPLDLGLRLAEYLPHARVAHLPRKLLDPSEHETALRRAIHDYLDEQH